MSTRIYLKLELEKSIANPDDRPRASHALLQDLEPLIHALGWRIAVVQRGVRPSRTSRATGGGHDAP